MIRAGLPIAPLVVGTVVVPAAMTAFGFSVYGDELSGVLSIRSASTSAGLRVAHPTRRPVPVRPTEEPLAGTASPASTARSPESVRRQVAELFARHGTAGVEFAPGGADCAGRCAEVLRELAVLLRGAPGAPVALVAHAWDGEAADRRGVPPAAWRAELVKRSLVARGVPEEAISTRVAVDPVWGPPSAGGPHVDVLVG